MKYTIVTVSVHEQDPVKALEESVRSLIRVGYVPVGGPVKMHRTNVTGTYKVYGQAMTKEDE